MNNLKSLTPMLMQQQKLMEPQEVDRQAMSLFICQMSKNLNEFQSTLDNISIAGRIMDTNLAENLTDEASDVGVSNFVLFIVFQKGG